jgi:hypothetical protein
MSAHLDVLLSIALVAVAGGFLVFRLVGPRSKKPACHPGDETPSTGVVVGDGLARGLAKAKARRAK